MIFITNESWVWESVRKEANGEMVTHLVCAEARHIMETGQKYGWIASVIWRIFRREPALIFAFERQSSVFADDLTAAATLVAMEPGQI
jgi:hypothetical protein